MWQGDPVRDKFVNVDLQLIGLRLAAPTSNIDHARYGSGKQRVIRRNPALLVLLVPFDGGEFRCARLGIDRIHLLLASTIDEQNSVAADSVEREIAYGQRGLTGNSSIECVAAGSQNPARCLGRLSFHGRNRSLASPDHRAHSRVRWQVVLSVNVANNQEEKRCKEW